MRLAQLTGPVFCYDQGMEPVVCTGCQALQRRLIELQGEVERLRRQLEEATRAGKRQAGPFAKVQTDNASLSTEGSSTATASPP